MNESEPPQRPDPHDDERTREREQLATLLTLGLTVFLGGGFVLFLIFISFGLFFWVLVMAAGAAVFVGLNYLMWGRRKPPDDE